MGHNHVVSGNPKSTRTLQVEELSMGPPDLGSHNNTFASDFHCVVTFIYVLRHFSCIFSHIKSR